MLVCTGEDAEPSTCSVLSPRIVRQNAERKRFEVSSKTGHITNSCSLLDSRNLTSSTNGKAEHVNIQAIAQVCQAGLHMACIVYTVHSAMLAVLCTRMMAEHTNEQSSLLHLLFLKLRLKATVSVMYMPATNAAATTQGEAQVFGTAWCCKGMRCGKLW